MHTKRTADDRHALLRDMRHALVGSVGTVFMMFYIAVASTVLQPFQCQEQHPQDKALA